MTARRLLKECLQFKKMKNDPLKKTLNDLLDKADETKIEYVLTQVKADIDAVAADKVSQKLKLQYAVHYLDNIMVKFDKETDMTSPPSTSSSIEKEEVATGAPDPTSQEHDLFVPRNPFATKMMARCPSCRRRTDVSQKCLDIQNRIKCHNETCNAKHAITQWFCIQCSKQYTKKQNNTNMAQIKIAHCDCWAALLSHQGKQILKCPSPECRGWRHNVDADIPTVDKRGPSMRRRCDVCGHRAALLNWNCSKCSQDGENIPFTNCDCCKKVRKPLYKKSQSLMKKSNIILRCPQTNCHGMQKCNEQDFPWLKKVRTVAKKVRCKQCRKRHSMWEWRCYRCNMSKFHCKCKRSDPNTLINACTPPATVL